MAPPARSVSGVIDVPVAAAESVRDALAIDLASTREWQAVTAKLEPLYAVHIARMRRRKLVLGAIGGSIGAVLTATWFAVRAILAASAAAGASAEAGRAQAEMVRRHEDQIRQLQLDQARIVGRLFPARFGRPTPDPTE